MKDRKPILVGVLIGILVLVGCLSYFFKKNPYEGFKIVSYSLNGQKVRLLVADTPEKREKGLMYYRKLEGVDGMIFIFSKKELLSFWNKNTYMDLDLYWIDDKKVVGKSYLPSIEQSMMILTVNSPEKVNKVIELPN